MYTLLLPCPVGLTNRLGKRYADLPDQLNATSAAPLASCAAPSTEPPEYTCIDALHAAHRYAYFQDKTKQSSFLT